MTRRGRWQHVFLLAAVMGGLTCFLKPGRTEAAEPDAKSLDPHLFGLPIPPGPIAAQPPRKVLTADQDGDSVVAQVRVQVGDYRIVLLPDGVLAARAVQDTTETNRAFEPLSKDAIAKRLTNSLPNGFRVKQTVRYLYVYDCSELFAEATSRILETMFRGVDGYMRAQKLNVQPPETPLVVIIFRTEAEFQRYRQMPMDVVAYYDVLSNRTVMYEETKLWQIKPDLARQQAISTIAHEGAHQILHNIGVQQRLSQWPMWLNEGLAEFLAPTTMDRQMKWKEVGQVNDLRMFELEQYIQGRAVENADGQLVAQTIGAARLTSTGYAAAWALTHYLAKYQREEFHRFLRDTSRLGPLTSTGHIVPPGVIPENVRLFKDRFGEDLAELERRLLLHLKRQPYVDPFAEWPHFAALISVPVGRRLRREANVFHTPEQAEKWCRECLEQVTAEQRNSATTAVRPFPNRLLAEQHARRWLDGS